MGDRWCCHVIVLLVCDRTEGRGDESAREVTIGRVEIDGVVMDFDDVAM